jgi:hypothetical protein
LQTLTKSIQDAINVQQVVDTAQAAAIAAPPQTVAFEAFAESAVRSDSSVAGVQQDLASLQQQVSAVQAIGASVSSLQQSVSALGGRVDAAIGAGSDLQSVRADLNTVKQQVQHFQALDVSDVTSKLGLVTSLDNRLSKLERVG